MDPCETPTLTVYSREHIPSRTPRSRLLLRKDGFSGLHIISFNPDRLPFRNDVTLDKMNVRADIRPSVFFEKISEHQEFV